jgi:hypothetical protein
VGKVEGGVGVFEGVGGWNEVHNVGGRLCGVVHEARGNGNEMGSGRKEVGLVGWCIDEEAVGRDGEHFTEFLGLVVCSLNEEGSFLGLWEGVD